MIPAQKPLEDGSYEQYLIESEKAPATIEKYLRDGRAFFRWRSSQRLRRRDVSVEEISRWKAELLEQGYAPTSVNAKLAALNNYFGFIGRVDLRVRFLKVQRRVFRDPARELSRKDYSRLLNEAHRGGKRKIALVMETICATGMRVSELKFLTIEALAAERVDVTLKGKIRTIFIPKKLRRKLWDYARQHKIQTGPVFLGSDGKPLSRYSVWAQMKALCTKAKVVASKVFPHNLRHLFAQAFYKVTNDIVKLADVLGHSSIETTRIYLMSSGEKYGRLIERLGLVV